MTLPAEQLSDNVFVRNVPSLLCGGAFHLGARFNPSQAHSTEASLLAVGGRTHPRGIAVGGVAMTTRRHLARGRHCVSQQMSADFTSDDTKQREDRYEQNSLTGRVGTQHFPIWIGGVGTT